ncbi:MAG: 16S rRNA (cytosine(1402)-N(4))-methyltransferase RsmH [Candidatus Pacebacteria bacterium]|nr:16S rRNA (cytosine(1402)-N(4))-methyltransferase RsmH [Candidatus Paceibacterota bacterium]
MHKPVLLNEVINILDIQEKDIVLDGTVGGGGYLNEICKKIGKSGMVIGLDQDISALERVREMKVNCRRHLVNENFRNLDKVLKELDIKKVDKIVFDLGFSSDQLEDSGRGFSFQKNEPLLMTFKKKPSSDDLIAKEIVNNWDEDNISDIISGYGEERFAKEIAKEIVLARKEKTIESTFELVEIIKKAVPKWYQSKRLHYATKTFQALRITVNDEIGSLKMGLEKAFGLLNEGGIIAIVSFHSLEDRVVKNYFRKLKENKEGLILTKKPIIPSREEIKNNPRSRSAKLRAIKLGS